MGSDLVVAWGRGGARPILRRVHRRLLDRHGLVDCSTMAGALGDLALEAVDAVAAVSGESLARWLMRALVGEGRYLAQRVPEAVAEAVWSCHARECGAERPTELVCFWQQGRMEWGDLALLDRQKGLSPHLWVMRRGATLSRQAAAACARSQVTRVWIGGHSMGVRAPHGAGMLANVCLDLNQWWAAEVDVASEHLAQLSAQAISEGCPGQSWVQPGGSQTCHYWRLVWRPRDVQVARPVFVRGGDVDRSEGTLVPRRIGLPELGAIPFYHVRQVEALHEALISSRVVFRLLGTLCDAHFKNKRIIARLRERRGLPRVETRGRPRRSQQVEERVASLVRDELLPVYQVWKRTGIPRSTVYDMLRDDAMRRGD